MQRSADVTTHINKFENVAYRLNVINQKSTVRVIVSKILLILPTKFKYSCKLVDGTLTINTGETNTIIVKIFV